jgi:hypothetical protein
MRTTGHAEIAARWGVDRSTVLRWEEKGYPLDDDVALARRVLQNRHAGYGPRNVAKEILASAEAESGDAASLPPMALQVVSTSGTGTDDDKLEANIQRLQGMLDGFAARLSVVKDPDSVKLYADLVAKYSGAITQARLAKKKLGIETGETLSRADAERLAVAIVDRLNVGCHRIVQTVSKQLTGLSTPGEAADVLQRACLEELLLGPIKAASMKECPVSLPDWLAAAFREGLDKVVEE